MAGKPNTPTQLPGKPIAQAQYVPPSTLTPDLVAISSEDGTLNVVAQLAQASPAMDDTSYGGWDIADVEGGRARPVWTGVGAPTISLALMFDGWRQNASVEGQISQLERMAGLTPGFTEPQPPKLIVRGAAVPHDASENPHYRWYISALSWTDPVIRTHPYANRVRQGFTLSLICNNPTPGLAKIKPRKAHPRYQRVRTTKAMNTFEEVAATKLHDHRLGRRLAELNGKRDPSQKMKPGTLIRLPSAHLLKLWEADIQRSKT